MQDTVINGIKNTKDNPRTGKAVSIKLKLSNE